MPQIDKSIPMKIFLHKFIVFIIISIVLLNTSGCFSIPIIPYVNEIKQKSEEIFIGRTTKNELRELYGRPVISSDYYQFDVFAGKCSYIAIAPIFPIPHEIVERCSAFVKYENNVVVNYDAHNFTGGSIVDDMTYDPPNVVIPFNEKMKYDVSNNINSEESISDKCQLLIYPINKPGAYTTVGEIFVDNKYVGHGHLSSIYKRYFHYLTQEPGKHRLSACYYIGSPVEDEMHCEIMEYECRENEVLVISPIAASKLWSSHKTTISFERHADFRDLFDNGYLIIGQEYWGDTKYYDH